MTDNKSNPPPPPVQIQIALDPDTAQGSYDNMAMVNHTKG